MRRSISRIAAFGVVVSGALAATPVFAHEKWYADEDLIHASLPPVFSEPTFFNITVIILAFIVFLAAYLLDRKTERMTWVRHLDRKLVRMAKEGKTVLMVALAASLMGAGLQRTFLVPNLHLPTTGYGIFLATASILLGLTAMFFVRYSPEVGIGLVLLYFAGFAVFSPGAMIEELLVLAIAVYLITEETHRRPWKALNTARVRRLGYHAFRIMLGIAFFVLSFVKWLRPDLGISLVEQYHVNFMAWAGFDSAMFVFCAAATELLIGLALILRVFVRPVALIGIFLFSASIFVFGFPELLGHLPIKASLFLLFIHGPYLKDDGKA